MQKKAPFTNHVVTLWHYLVPLYLNTNKLNDSKEQEHVSYIDTKCKNMFFLLTISHFVSVVTFLCSSWSLWNYVIDRSVLVVIGQLLMEAFLIFYGKSPPLDCPL